MSEEIDENIVSIKFDNKSFEKDVVSTINAIEELKKSLNFSGVVGGLDKVQNEVDRFNLQNIADAVDNISSKFGVLGAVAFTGIQKLTNGVIDAGIKMGSALVDPILSGGSKRALAIENAKFQFRGLGLDVEKTMESARLAVTGTAFGLDAAATAAAQFGGSGIKAGKDMTGALRAIAGVAAQTNTSFEEMSDVFTSAAGKGKISGYELQRIAQRGLNVAAVLGKQWGKTETEIRTLASKGKISFKQFAEAMDEAFGKNAQKANETYTGSLANMRAALSRIGANILGPRFEAMKDVFNAITPVIDKINEALKPFYEILAAIQRNAADALIGWLKKLNLEPLQKLVWLISKGLLYALDAVKSIIKPITEAFRDIFPAPTIKQLTQLAAGFRDFFKNFKIGAETTNFIHQAFKTFFIVIRLGLRIIRESIRVVRNFFSAFLGSNDGVNNLTDTLGNFFEKLNYFLLKASSSKDFFDKLAAGATSLGDRLRPLVDALKKIAAAFGALFRGDIAGFWANLDLAGYAVSDMFDGLGEKVKTFADAVLNKLGPVGDVIKGVFDGIASLFGKTSEIDIDTGKFDTAKLSLDNLKGSLDSVKSVWDKVKDAFSNLGGFFEPIIKTVGGFLKGLGEKFKEWFDEADFQDLVALINTGFLIALYIAIRDWIKSLENLTSAWSDIAKSFTGFIDEMSETLKAMQTSIKADALLKIGIAIALIAASIVALALLDRDALIQGTAVIAGIFAAITGLYVYMDRFSKNVAGSANVLAISASIIGIAIAIRLLVSSVKSLGKLDPSQMEQGLVGVGLLAGAIALLISALALAGPQVAAAGGTLLLISGAIVVLSGVVALLGQMGIDTIGKGLLALTGIVTLINVLIAGLVVAGAMGPVVLAGGAALLLASGAIAIMAKVVEQLGKIPIASLVAAMAAMTAMVSVLGLLMAAAAIGNAFSLAGAGGILMIAIALKIMADAVEQLGNLSIANLAKGIGALIALNAVLVIVAVTAGIVSPLLLLLGTGLALLGVGMLAAGTGMFLFAAGLTALATLGTAGFLVIASGIETLLNLLPLFAQQFGYAIIALANVLGEAVPEIISALGKFWSAFLAEIRRLAPELGETFEVVVREGLTRIRNLSGDLVDTAVYLLGELIRGLRENARQLADGAAGLIVDFINGLNENIQDIIDAGTSLLLNLLWGITSNVLIIADTAATVLVTFLNGLADEIREHDQEINDAGRNVGAAIFEGIVTALVGEEAFRRIQGAIRTMVGWLPEWAQRFLGIRSPSRVFAEIGKYVVEGLAVGLADSRSRAELKDAFKKMNNVLKDGIKDLNEEIKRAQEERERLLDNGNASYKEIAKVNAKIAELQQEKARVVATQKAYVNNLDDERAKLLNLAKSYETVTAKLDQAKQKLADLKQEKQSKRDELFNQYYQLPDIEKTTGLQGYLQEARNTIEETKRYKASLDQLRKQGLDDRAYEKLLQEGPDAQSLVNQLNAGGKQAIREFNNVNAQIASQANKLAKDAAGKLYDAGIRAAEGIVKGLQNQQKNIDGQMKKIADSMVKQIKKGLGIKSPSREFAKVALFAIRGLIQGFIKNRSLAGDAAAKVGDETVDKMREAFDRVKEIANSEIDTRPVIAPVIDLTDFRKGIKDINSSPPELDVSASVVSARAAYLANRQQTGASAEETSGVVKQVIFNQTNNSPEALSNLEIYRQTKTLVSQAKGS